MKVFYIVALLSLIISFSQAQINQEIEDTKHEQSILIDEVDKLGFMAGSHQEWFLPEHDAYLPDMSITETLSALLADSPEIEILVFMSTWCSDSREQIPRFYKVIEAIEKTPKMTVYALDENKTCRSVNTEDYNIERVPTFIFYLEGEEIGRITETPNETLEKDFLQILVPVVK